MQYTIKPQKAISDHAADIIRNMVFEGHISDGERLNEVKLSKQLGISRTPLREGLGRLVAEHFVHVIPRRGFFVKVLTPHEFSDLYDLRPMLDPKALLLGGQPTKAEIDAIERANAVFMRTEPGAPAVNADEEFHRLLLKRCPNAVLLDLIDNLMMRTRRYELALFRETTPVRSAGNKHKEIIQALRVQDLNAASDRLLENLTAGKEPILNWLKTRLN